MARPRVPSSSPAPADSEPAPAEERPAPPAEPLAGGPEPERPPQPPATPTAPAEPALDLAERQRLERAVAETRRELDQMRQWRAGLEQATRGQVPAAPDLNTLLFERPEEALRHVEQRIEQKLEARYQQDQAQQQQVRAMQDFERDLYTHHKELVGEEWLVNAVFQRAVAQGQLLDLPVGKARDELARQVREEILRLEKRAGEFRTRQEGRTVPPGRAVVEGGGSGPAEGRRAPPSDEDSGPKTLSDLIRARQRARREARG
jgi:hypothetical protein